LALASLPRLGVALGFRTLLPVLSLRGHGWSPRSGRRISRDFKRSISRDFKGFQGVRALEIKGSRALTP
jgi:hypothetical protein